MSENARITLPNPYLGKENEDLLYHFGISTTSHDFPTLFGNVRFVCVGGSTSRMEQFASFINQELNPAGEKPQNLSLSDRFVLYKAGPVLCANHGMGVPSMSILLHELLKLLFYAGCSDVTFIRIGTCGGIGVQPGSIIVSNAIVNSKFEENHEVVVLGKRIRRPIVVDQGLADDISSCSQADDNFKTILGTTYTTDDFYEGQARTNGAVCDITEADVKEFVEKLHKMGVRNIEMEGSGFVALCHKAGVKSAVVCVTLLDRLSAEELPNDGKMGEWQMRPQRLVSRFIKKRLGL